MESSVPWWALFMSCSRHSKATPIFYFPQGRQLMVNSRPGSQHRLSEWHQYNCRPSDSEFAVRTTDESLRLQKNFSIMICGISVDHSKINIHHQILVNKVYACPVRILSLLIIHYFC